MKIAKQSLLYSGCAVLYVIVVATLMRNAERLFGSDKPDSVLAPISILLLLVVSAATMGMLIFGKPVMLYIDGKKREAVTMLVCTVGSLAVITAAIFISMSLSRT